ncbi:solute carrier family 35 member E1 homolog [Liolophura sinensis]|uniref:solute carrier family 35 member E1 homolog n=1 Tax=Liolophura sinensis TaxID=3198878 RepID=UPI0031583B6A
MTDHADYFTVVKVISLCAAWYTVSSAQNIIGKTLLSDFPYPMTVAMVQLMSICLYTIPVTKVLSVPPVKNIPRRYYLSLIIPLALAKFTNSVTAHISIWKVPVSYAHTVKATMPLFTVLLSRILMGERQTYQVYFSLLPIIGGVAIATVTELSFNVIGLASALLATMGFSLQNIFSKKCLRDTGIHHIRLLLILAKISTLCFIPLWLLVDLRKILRDEAVMNSGNLGRTMYLLVVDGACNVIQNVVAFSILALITPLSYAVASATKRIVIISASLIMLRNPVTWMNMLGMFTAIIGVLIYNKAKYDQQQAKRREKVLPYVKSDTNLSRMSNALLNGATHGWNTSGFLNHPNGYPVERLQIEEVPAFSHKAYLPHINHNEDFPHKETVGYPALNSRASRPYSRTVYNI